MFNLFQLEHQIEDGMVTPVPVAVVGAPGVGKSTFIKQMQRLFEPEKAGFTNDSGDKVFSLNGQLYRSTDTGLDFCLDRGEQLQIIHSHHMFLIFYAIDNQDSFKEMVRLKTIIQETKTGPAKIIIVGNMLDQQKAMADSVTADCIVTIDWGLQHIEISAKSGENMEKIADLFDEEENNTDNIKPLPKKTSRKRRNTIQLPCYGDITLLDLNIKERKHSLRKNSFSKFFQRCTNRILTAVN